MSWKLIFAKYLTPICLLWFLAIFKIFYDIVAYQCQTMAAEGWWEVTACLQLAASMLMAVSIHSCHTHKWIIGEFPEGGWEFSFLFWLLALITLYDTITWTLSHPSTSAIRSIILFQPLSDSLVPLPHFYLYMHTFVLCSILYRSIKK